MKTFTRSRTLKELRTAVRKAGWGRVNSKKHDEQGYDHVSFKFKVGKVSGKCLYNTFNGRFLAEVGHDLISSDETTHDHKRWFQALLRTCYIK